VCEVRQAQTDLAERRGALIGPLRISAPVTFGRMHLGPALYGFLAKYPDIQLTLDLNDRRVDATSDGFDAVIRNGPIVDSFLVAWQLAPSPRYLVAAPAYLARHGTPANLEELAEHRGIFYTNRGTADWRFVDGDQAYVVQGDGDLVLNNGDMMLDAAIAGLGISLLPAFIVGQALRDGKLTKIDVGMQAEPEFLYIGHPHGRKPSAKLRALAGWLKDAFGDPPYWDN
jgi:DNA-binding transcriptional LysR family regulator